MNAICIGCGCDEHHACQVDVNIDVDPYGCWWLRFDARAGVGLCSACGDLVRAWDSAKEHRPLITLIAERYYRQLLFLYGGNEAEALAWMTSPQPLLLGAVPKTLIQNGELERVRQVVCAIADGAFV